MTSNFIDNAAILKNKIALRDRMKTLLDKTDEMSDILYIEKELSRLQSEIDSLQAHMATLKDKSEMSEIDIRLERTVILGPVGYVFKGVLWTIGKLFVIRG